MQADLRICISDRNHNAVIYIAIRVADLVDIAFDAFLARQRGINHNIANITKRCSVRFSDVKVLSTVHHLHLPDTAIFPNQKQNYSRSESHFYAWPIPYKLQKEMPPFVGGHLLFTSLIIPYGADGKLAEVGKELWSITDETGAAVDTLSDGTLYELRVSVADGGAFDLSEAEKEIKISVVLAK